MADEARLNELLDLVEQARKEGDKETEAKAVAAYKRESAPSAPAETAVKTAPKALPKAPEPKANFSNPYEYFTPAVQRGLGNTGEGAQPAVGASEAALQVGTGLGASALGGLAGLANAGFNISPVGYLAHKAGLPKADSADVVSKIQGALTYQPKTYAGDVASQAVSDAFDPNVKTSWLNPLAIPSNVGVALGDASSEAGAPAWLSTSLRMAPEVLAPYAVGKAGDAIRGAESARVASKPAPAPIPTTADLKSASGAAYKAADDAGVVIDPKSTAKVVGMMNDVAKSENLGKLPPKIAEASRVLQERIDANDPLTLRDADKVRQLINDAKASTDASDRRIAKIVQSKYDDYLNNLTAADTLSGDAEAATKSLNDARDLYRRQKNSELVDSIIKRANNTGEANYTQAGTEAALRREFLKIVNNDRKARTFTPEQQAAMQQVAAPGALANTLRNVGKMDPLKGGVPAAISTLIGGGVGALGGPIGSVAGATALGTLAHFANRGAARITNSNVAAAREALVGRGLPSANMQSPPGLLANTQAQAVAPASKAGLLASQEAHPQQQASPAPPRIRPSTEIQADIQRLSDRVRFELANEDASSPKVQAAIDELQTLQRELAASQANR